MRLLKQEKWQTNNRINTTSRNIDIVKLTKTCKRLACPLLLSWCFFVHRDVLGDAEEQCLCVILFKKAMSLTYSTANHINHMNHSRYRSQGQIFTLWNVTLAICSLLLFRTTSCYRVTLVLNNTGCLNSVSVCACVSERRDVDHVDYVYASLSFSFIIT